MKVLRSLVLPAVISLALLAGCNPENPVLPDPYGAEGYCIAGWDAYEVGDYELAMEHFQSAIEVDITYPGGYLGAGWAALNLSDYWIAADSYFYMALQQDLGYAPLVTRTEITTQDTMWTVFECLDPALPPAVLDPILEMTADSGLIWVGEEIYPLVYNAGAGDTEPDIPYRFHVQNEIPVALLFGTNGFSQQVCQVDSIVSDGEGGMWIYLNGNYRNVTIGDDNYRTWISADNDITYEYINLVPGAMSQFSYDALAGWALLQHVRGDNGDALVANAAVWALDHELDEYVFGAGAYREGLVDLSMVQLKGMAASTAFNEESFAFAWFDCTSEGYGMELNRRSPDFLFLLVQVIESMLNFEG